MFNVVEEVFTSISYDSPAMPASGSAGPPARPRPVAMPQSNKVGIFQPTSAPVAFEIRKIFPETWMFESFDFNDT